MIVSAAINFSLIHRGITRFKAGVIADGRAWRVDGRAQALVGPGLATPLLVTSQFLHTFNTDTIPPDLNFTNTRMQKATVRNIDSTV